MTISTPLDLATDGRDAMIAIGMNGEPLPREHGFPARMVVPGLYGFVERHQVDHPHDADDVRRAGGVLDRARLGDRRPDQDSPAGSTPPGRSSTIDAGQHRHRRRRLGPAAAASSKVEVRVDGGAWQEAELGPDGGIDYWRQWYLALGRRARAALRSPCAPPTRDGEVQTAARATPFPDGSSGIQEIVVNVA